MKINYLNIRTKLIRASKLQITLLCGFILLILQKTTLSVSIFDTSNGVTRDALGKKIGSREIIIKIGVLAAEERKGKYFWVEFDPQNEFVLHDNNLLLPYLVVPREDKSVDKIPFYVNEQYPGCSSANPLKKEYPDMTVETFKPLFQKNCQDYESSKQGPIKLWDGDSTVEDSINQALGPSFDCLNGTIMNKNPVSFSQITLPQVLNDLQNRKIHLLDIDAQGSDTGILFSLAKHLQYVHKIKLEW